jgi:hypothetical protein
LWWKTCAAWESICRRVQSSRVLDHL